MDNYMEVIHRHLSKIIYKYKNLETVDKSVL